MNTSNPPKWEYKVVNIQSHRVPGPAELTTAQKVADILNKDGQGHWELINTIHQADNILPEGFVILKRQYEAPAVVQPRKFGALLPKVAVPAKK